MTQERSPDADILGPPALLPADINLARAPHNLLVQTFGSYEAEVAAALSAEAAR